MGLGNKHKYIAQYDVPLYVVESMCMRCGENVSLPLSHTHTHLHSLFEFPDVGYVIFILFYRQSYTRCLLSNIKGLGNMLVSL